MVDEPQDEDAGHAAGDARPGARRPRRWRRRLLVAALVPLLLYLTREYTLHPLLVRSAPWLTARFTPHDLELADIDGGWFGGLRLEGVRVRSSEPDGELLDLEVEQLEARWSLLALVRGEQRWLRSVRAAGIDGDVVLAPSAPDEAEDTAPPPELPRLLPTLDIERLSLRVHTAGGALLELDGARLSVADAEDAQAVEASGRLAYTDAAGARRVHTFDAALAWRAAEVELERVTLDGTALVQAGGTLDLRELHQERIQWDVGLALPADRAHTSGVLDGSNLRAMLDLARLDLAATRARLAPLLPELPDDLAGVLTVDGEVALELAAPRPRGTLRVVGDGIVAAGRRVTSLELYATGDGATAGVTRLEVRAPGGRCEGTEISVSLDSLTTDALLASLRGALVIEADSLGELLHGARLAELPDLPEHRLDVRARLADGALHLDAGRLDVAGGHVDVTGGSVELLAQGGRGRAAAVLLDVDLPDLAAFGALLDAGEWSGSLTGKATLAGELPLLVGHAELAGTDVLLAGVPLGAVDVSVDASRERITVTRCEATSAEAEARLSGAWLIEESALVGLVLDVDVLAPEHLQELVAEGGHLAVHAELAGPLDALSGSVRADGALLRVGGAAVHAFELVADAQDGVFDVTVLRAALDQGSVDAQLVASLPRGDRPLEVRLNALELTGDGAHLALVGPVSIEHGDERVALEGLELAGDAGRIVADVELVGERMHARVALEGLDPMPFVAGIVPAGFVARGIDASLELDSDAGSLTVSGGGRVAELRTPADEAPFELVWRGALEQGRATLAELRATTGGVTVLDLTASLPLDPRAAQPLVDGPLALAGHVTLPPGRSVRAQLGERTVTITGALAVAIDLAGTWRGLSGTVGVDAHSIAVDAGADSELFLPEPATFALALALGAEGVALERLSLDAPRRARIDATGKLALAPDVLAVTAADFDWRAPALELRGDYEVADMAWLETLSEDLRRLGGSARGAFDLGGTLAEPTGSVDFALRDGNFKTSGAPSLERLAIDARYTDGVVQLLRLDAELGAAPLHVEGSLEGLLDGHPVAAFDVTGENVLLSRTASARMRADLALRIVGPLDALVARGDMHLRNARVTQSIDFLGALQGVGANGVSSQQAGLAIVLAEEGPLATLELDVNVDTAEPISIVSNVMRGSVNVSLHVGGTGALVILDGRVFLEPTRILLPSGTLQMQSGFIQFNEDNPLFPRLEVFGEARLLGYDITVAVSGRYDEPIVDLSSVPPLPKEDLLVLLLTGNLPSGVTGAQAAQALTVYLARDLLKRWADDGLDNEGETLAERLEFVSGRDVSKAGVLTMEATYKLREQLFGERDVVYIAAERDRYEDYNLGLRFVLRLK